MAVTMATVFLTSCEKKPIIENLTDEQISQDLIFESEDELYEYMATSNILDSDQLNVINYRGCSSYQPYVHCKVYRVCNGYAGTSYWTVYNYCNDTYYFVVKS